MLVLNYVPQVGFFLLFFALVIKIQLLKNKRINVKTGSNRKSKWLSILFLIPFILLLFEIFKPIFFKSISILPAILTNSIFDTSILKIAGSLIIFLSLLLWLVTLFHFKTSIRFGLNEKNSGKLITTGIFSVSRNPFFISIDLYFIGIAISIPSIFFIGFAFLAVISIHFFILKEEKHLKKVYGKDYEDYTKKVRRYF